MTAAPLIPVILCGGTGTRLWPVSRRSLPKQFWPLAGRRSMLQETALRATGPGFAPPIVMAGEEQRFTVAEHLREAGIVAPRILLEPEGRNSGPAIAAAACLAAEDDPGAILWIMASDAAVTDVPALHAALSRAVPAARAGRIVTFGMTPDAPETGYGYIEPGEAVGDGVYAVASFLEKPDLALAGRLLAGGRHLWNAGMFVASAAALLEEFDAHAPAVLAAAGAAVAAAERDLGFIRLGADAFAAAPSISVDHAVMERTRRAAVVPARIGWSDVGSWDALWQASPRDGAGNALSGQVEALDCEGCLIRADGLVVAAVGLRDVALVVTDDAVLAMPRGRAQEVKQVVERLRERGIPEATEHRRVYRPWGHYQGLIAGGRFQVKQITVRPGGRLSLQMHHHRAEHWVVVQGTARVRRGDQDILLGENESAYLPLGTVHRLENPGKIPLVLIEVQTGAYLGEDDILRLEDSYGRG